MSRQKQVRTSSGKKGEVPDAFRQLKEMSFDRFDYLSRGEAFEAKRVAATIELRDFWNTRLYDSVTNPNGKRLFTPGYKFSEDYYFAAMELKAELGRSRIREWYPSEDSMRLFVLLSEPDFDRECQVLVYDTFREMVTYGYRELGKAQLVTMLHLDALVRLIQSIGGIDTVSVLNECRECDVEHKVSLVEKVVEAHDKIHEKFGNFGVIPSLVDYIIRFPGDDEALIALTNTGGRAAEVAKDIISHLSCHVRVLQETLSRWTRR